MGTNHSQNNKNEEERRRKAFSRPVFLTFLFSKLLERQETKTRRESKGGQKGRTRRCLTSAPITHNFVFVIKHQTR
jgi:hypothetical protein